MWYHYSREEEAADLMESLKPECPPKKKQYTYSGKGNGEQCVSGKNLSVQQL